MDLGRRIRRVVRKADPILGRSEKSEVLSDDILAMEKVIEMIRQSFGVTFKRLQACLPPVADPEKRLKRLPESALSVTLNESATNLSQSPVFAKAFTRFGEAEQYLADEMLQFVMEVEKSVLQPLSSVVDKDIPAIMKIRKQLTNMAIDLDSAKKSYTMLLKQGQGPPGKVDSAREEVEAEEVRVDQCRDQFVTEMYQFFSGEEKLCKLLLSALQLQADYHRNALRALEQQISQMNEEIELNAVKPVYGCDLREHLAYTKQEIATVIEICVQAIQKCGLDTEGIFRIAPASSKLRKITAAFDANVLDVDGDDIDAHCLAGALKLYLRELPEPLMTSELFNDWIDATQRPAPEKFNALLSVIKKLPKANFNNLRFLIRFLSKVAEQSDVNKMSASNLAIVIGPNLLYPSKASLGNVQVAGVAVSIVDLLILHSDWFFPNDDPAQSNSSHIHVEENKNSHKRSPDVERALKQPETLPRPRKPPAPGPPIGSIGKQRSESTPDYNNTSVPPETIIVGRPKQPVKPATRPPLPPALQRPAKSEGSADLLDARYDVKAEESTFADHASSEQRAGTPLELDDHEDDDDDPRATEAVSGRQLTPSPNRLVRSEAIDREEPGVAFSEIGQSSVDEEEFDNHEVFDSVIYAHLDDSTGRSTEIHSPNKIVESPHLTELPGTPPLGTAAHIRKGSLKNSSKAVSPKEIADDFQIPGKARKNSFSEAMSSMMPGKFRSVDMNVNKSATLPPDNVSLCRITFRSEDSTDASPKQNATENAATGKVRPKVPPRSPPKDTRGQTSVNLLENTHL